MEDKDKIEMLELELKQIRNSLRNLEMSISPLKREHLERICWITAILQPRKTSKPLIRLGSEGDGGYVLLPPKSGKITLSIGVGEEISADLDLIENFNQVIYAFDPFISLPIGVPESFIFHKIGLAAKSKSGSNKFEDIRGIMKRLPEIPEIALIDIEGDELELIGSLRVISGVKQIVMEIHGLDQIVDNTQFSKLKKLLTQMSKTHYPIHVHGNNDGSTVRLPGAVWPSIIEVTFLRKDQFDVKNPDFNFGPWPGLLDFPNSKHRPDLDLDPFFGPKANYRANLSI